LWRALFDEPEIGPGAALVAERVKRKDLLALSHRLDGGKFGLAGTAALHVSAEGKEVLGFDRLTGRSARPAHPSSRILEMNLDRVTPQAVSQTQHSPAA
jgi:hypothetical protein